MADCLSVARAQLMQCLRQQKGLLMQQKLEMPGEEDFGRLIESNAYYVDRTKHLRPLLTKIGNVSFFTRPRRFGKTLTMTMLRDFLQFDFKKPFLPLETPPCVHCMYFV